MTDVATRVRVFAAREGFALDADSSVLLALSGGADSVALLSVLTELGVRVEALHVHHGIRGAEADRDAAFCLALCARMGVPCGVVYTDIPAIAARRGVGEEEAARDERYRLLCAFARGRIVCTAHNATDHLETLLFRLVRGTGPAGLVGIPPRRGQIVRPLLECSRAEIEEYLRARGLAYVTDSTNTDPDYAARNHIRHRVLPALYELRADAERAACELAATMRAQEAYLQAVADTVAENAPPDELAALAEPIFVRVMMRRLRAAGLPLVRETIAAARDLCRGRCGDKRTVAGATLYHDGTRLSIVKNDSERPMPTVREVMPETVISGEGYAFLATKSPEKAEAFQNIYNFATTVCICSATIEQHLTLRPRSAGDSVLCRGVHHSVKNLMQAAGVPARDRSHLPFLVSESGIVWIPGVALTDGAAGDEAFLLFADLTKEGRL